MSENRRIRVFVSSTFRDMVEERNELMTQTWPELRRFCRERQVELVEVDLRWGIAEEQSTRKETLKLCLDEIRACRPFFIGLLGERYGWAPGADAFTADLKEEQQWLRGLGGKSVTELEILHGVLNNPEMAGRAYFYFRDPAYAQAHGSDFLPEDGEAVGKQTELKETIRRACAEKRIPLRENYADSRTVAALVLEDLKAAIEEQFPIEEIPDPLTREARDHEAFAETRRRTYIGRPEYIARLDSHAESDGGPLVLAGDSGSGKSALMANWVEHWRTVHPNDFFFQHYIGGTPDSASHWSLMARLIAEIKRWTGDPEDAPRSHDDLLRDFPLWLARARCKSEYDGVRCILVLDALNQLEDHDYARLLGWLPSHPFAGGLRLVVSTLPGETMDAVMQRGWESLRVEPLTHDERRRMVEHYLARFGKKLDSVRLDRLATAPAAANPLYLKILLDELRVTGTHDRLDERLNDYLSAPDIPTLLQQVLERYQRDYERDRPGLVSESLGLIWAARRGLSEPELLRLLKPADKERLPQAVWSPLRAALEEGLVARGGILNFAHDFLRSAVELAFLGENRLRELRMRMVDYFAAVPEPSDRKLDELPRLYCELKKWEDLKTLVADIPTFLHLRSTEQRQVELHQYWARLNPFFDAGVVYRDAVRALAPTQGEGLDMPELLSQVGNFHNERGDKSSAESFYLQALQLVDPSDQASDLERAATANNLGCFYVASGRLKEAEPLLRNALDISEHYSRGQLNHAKALGNLGQLLLSLKRSQEAEPLLRKELSIKEARLGSMHPGIATTLNSLALALIYAGSHSEAESFLRRACAIQEANGGENNPDVATALHNLGAYLAATGRIGEAHSLFERGSYIVKNIFGADSPQQAPFLQGLQYVREESREKQDTESVLREELRRKEMEYGATHHEVASTLLQLAKVFADRGRESEVEALLSRTLSIIEADDGCDNTALSLLTHNFATVLYGLSRLTRSDPLWVQLLNLVDTKKRLPADEIALEFYALAEVMRKESRPSEAEPLYRRAIAILDGGNGEGDSNLATCLHGLALSLQRMDRLGEAEDSFKKAIAKFRVTVGDRQPQVAAALSGLGLLLLYNNRSQEAEPILLNALAIQREVHGDEHPDTASAINNLGMLYAAMKRFSEAAELFERSLSILGPFIKRRECPELQARTTISNYSKTLELLGMSDAEINAKIHNLLP
jgi:nephrocystin-3